jgi:hypothetical protein
MNDAVLHSWMDKSDNIPIHHSYYLKWKQVYNTYKTSDIKLQPFFGNKKCICYAGIE